MAQALAAAAFEVQRGGIEEDQTDLAEQIVAQGEQTFLDEVLGGSRRQAAPALVGEFLAEPTHRAIEVMEVEVGDARDDHVVSPLLGSAVGAGVEQAMQDAQEDRAFEVELELAVLRQFLDHALAAGLPPQAFEGEGRAELAGGDLGGLAVVEGGEHDGGGGEAGAGAQQAVDFAACHQVVDAAEGGDHGLPWLAVNALILDDLKILGFAGELASKEHGGSKPRAP